MLGTTGFVIFVVLSIAVAIVCVVAMLCASAILFSRVAFSLAVALIMSQGEVMLVASNGFLNFVAWALVVMGIVYFLAMMPRVDMALKFLCTILLSVVIVCVVIQMCGGIIAAIAKTEFKFSSAYEILVKIVCCLFSAVYMVVGKKPSYDSPSNKLLNILERLLASVIYGVAVTFLTLSFGGNWESSILLTLLTFVVSTVAAYVADICLAGKDVLGLESSDEVVMPK